MYALRVIAHFAAAHRLRDYQGKCEALHGHNWKVEVEVVAKGLNPLGMVMDFKELKDLVNICLDKLDHTYLNEVPPFDKQNPTSELIAQYLFHEIRPLLPTHVMLKCVTVWESETACAQYWEEDEQAD